MGYEAEHSSPSHGAEGRRRVPPVHQIHQGRQLISLLRRFYHPDGLHKFRRGWHLLGRQAGNFVDISCDAIFLVLLSALQPKKYDGQTVIYTRLMIVSAVQLWQIVATHRLQNPTGEHLIHRNSRVKRGGRRGRRMEGKLIHCSHGISGMLC